MAIAIAWGLYVSMAALLMFGYERYLTPYLAEQRQLRIFLRALMAILLFTPGFVLDSGSFYLVPACVGVMFNILAHKPVAVMQAALPLLLAATVVYGILLFRERSQAQ